MATTTIQPLPYPLPGDPADGPAQIKALAEAVEGRLVMRFASLAARDAALPSGTLVDGMMCHVASENAVYLRSGGQWRLMWRDSGWVPVPLGPGVSGSCSARRIGQIVEIRWACSTSIAAGGALTVVAAGGIPTDYRPTPQNRPASVWGQGTYPLVGLILTAGTVSVRNVHSAAISDHAGSAMYIVD